MSIGPAAFPNGPALAYIESGDTDAEGTHTIRLVDRDVPADPRERALCRALLLHALQLLDASEPTRPTAMRAERPRP